jgi:hypothetical protein
MLARSSAKLGPRGLPLKEMYPNGVPTRTFPYRDHPKHPALAPSPGGWWIGKRAVGIPLSIPYVWDFYKSPIAITVILMAWDIIFGLPAALSFFNRDHVPGQSHHYWGNNGGGIPHHLWCYQDGWYMPNHSGVKRETQ